jgi:hypothetical protein
VTGEAFGLCAVCCREITVRGDGRLRAHLAATSRPGHREQCDGSGAPSARSDLIPGEAGYERGTVGLTRAAAFNAREEWRKVDALYFEYRDMTDAGAASPDAIYSAYMAYSRAWDDARQLAPWWAVAHYPGLGGSA